MKKHIKVLLVCTMLLAMSTSVVDAAGTTTKATTTASTTSTTFKDIKGHWAEKEILAAYKKGIVSGFPDGTFKPNQSVTVDQFIKMLLLSLTEKDSAGKIKWASKYVNNLDPTTRYNLNETLTQFDFNKVPVEKYWAAPYLREANILTIASASDPVFEGRFTQDLTREVAAHILNDTISKYEFEENVKYAALALSSIKDGEFIDQDLLFDVESVILKGVMRGQPDKSFRPRGFVTRAEAVIMLNRLLSISARNPYVPTLQGANSISYTVKGLTRKVVFQSPEFVTNLAAMKKMMPLANGYAVNTGLSVNFYASKSVYDSYTKEFSGPNGIMAKNPALLSYGIGPTENDYFITLDTSNDYNSMYGDLLKKLSDTFFESDSEVFNTKFKAFLESAKTNNNDIKAQDFLINKRAIRLLTIKGTSNIRVFIPQKN